MAFWGEAKGEGIPRILEVVSRIGVMRNGLSLYCLGVSLLVLLALGAAALLVIGQSWPVWSEIGWGWFAGKEWFYRDGEFGALSMVYGSAVVAFIAVGLAVPIGVVAAIYLSEYLPERFRLPAKTAVELLAGVPSVVYGLLAILFLRGWVDRFVEPFGGYTGDTLLTAGLILAVMVLPTLVTLSHEALQAVPGSQRQAARGLGLTRAETILHIVLPRAAPGLLATVFLGFGRAIGETIAVFLVVGRMDNQWPENPFSPEAWIFPGQTLTSKLGGPETFIAYGDSLHWAAMMGLGVLLLAMVMASLLIGRLMLWLPGFMRKRKRWGGEGSESKSQGQAPETRQTTQWTLSAGRRVVRRVLPVTGFVAAGFTLGLLVAILTVLVVRGGGSVNVSFLTNTMRAAGAEGGILGQITGTLILVGTAAAVSVPLALAVAVVRSVHLRSRARIVRWVDDGLQLLNGIPSILFGIVGVVFFLQILGWGKSWLAGGVVLAVMILPTVTVALAERLAAVPKGQIEAAIGLGLRRDQVIRAIWLRQSWGGLWSGLFLGLARAAGETAPILFVAAVFSGVVWPEGVREAPVTTLPYHIFTLAQDSLDAGAQANLWGAALVLVALVVLLNGAAYPLRSRQVKSALEQ